MQKTGEQGEKMKENMQKIGLLQKRLADVYCTYAIDR